MNGSFSLLHGRIRSPSPILIHLISSAKPPAKAGVVCTVAGIYVSLRLFGISVICFLLLVTAWLGRPIFPAAVVSVWVGKETTTKNSESQENIYGGWGRKDADGRTSRSMSASPKEISVSQSVSQTENLSDRRRRRHCV